jgi:hypothetical protein
VRHPYTASKEESAQGPEKIPIVGGKQAGSKFLSEVIDRAFFTYQGFCSQLFSTAGPTDFRLVRSIILSAIFNFSPELQAHCCGLKVASGRSKP